MRLLKCAETLNLFIQTADLIGPEAYIHSLSGTPEKLYPTAICLRGRKGKHLIER